MRGLAALVLTLCLLVSGCGGDDPQPAPSPTKSPSPSETTPTPPEMPEAARERDRAGSELFVRHYIELLNHAQSTGETAPMREAEEPTCRSCKSIREDLENLYASGGSLEGGSWKIARVLDSSASGDSGRVISLVVEFGPQVVRRPAPAKPERLEGGSLPLTMNLSATREGWIVRDWTRGR